MTCCVFAGLECEFYGFAMVAQNGQIFKGRKQQEEDEEE